MNTTTNKKFRNVDMAHLALVQERDRTGAICDKLLDAGVSWDSDEYQAARKANSEANAKVVAYSKAKNAEIR